MQQSAELFARARQIIPGGVNSPVRAFNSVGGTPIYFRRGAGARMTSVEGREYLDFCGSWGPLILGHAHPRVVAAVREAAGEGLSFGANTPREITLAELVRELVPYMEMVRLMSSGTEACMTALRLARGCTGRRKVLKFEGCYHGHSDAFLVAAGSGLLTSGVASSAGVPPGVASDTCVLPYNDLAAVRRLAAEIGSDLAAIIVEPVAGNMGLVAPAPGFLAGLREVASKCGALLIFDEVITGFRLGPTTYGKLCGVTPDLTTLGKIIGGGMPIGAIGGRRELMEKLAPVGPVYQAGTLSGNPVAVAAGIATLTALKEENPYPAIAARGAKLADGLNALAAKAARGGAGPAHCAHLGGTFTLYFGAPPMTNLTEIKRCDIARFNRFFHGMLAAGIYLPPSQFELGFISAAHSDADIAEFLAAAAKLLTP